MSELVNTMNERIYMRASKQLSRRDAERDEAFRAQAGRDLPRMTVAYEEDTEFLQVVFVMTRQNINRMMVKEFGVKARRNIW